jgi:REP element-mobilizing transposase RayT
MAWHMMQRSKNRSAGVDADEDYRFSLDRLIELSQTLGCAVHASALRTNHVHWLRTPERADSAPLTMKHSGQRYVQYINRTDKRSGALWATTGAVSALSWTHTFPPHMTQVLLLVDPHERSRETRQDGYGRCQTSLGYDHHSCSECRHRGKPQLLEGQHQRREDHLR